VDTRSEIREFLTSRRARITPDQVGLPSYGSRRVPGLRRDDEALRLLGSWAATYEQAAVQ